MCDKNTMEDRDLVALVALFLLKDLPLEKDPQGNEYQRGTPHRTRLIDWSFSYADEFMKKSKTVK